LVAGSPGGFIGSDATINLQAGSISTAGNLDVEIDNFGGGSIGGDALVNVGVSNDINIVGDAIFQILNNDGGHIGGNANILLTTGGGGDLTANSILAFVNNHNAGTIDSGASLTFDIGGALTTTGDATFVISNLNDGTGGGTIGSLATVDLNAASVSVGGFFQTFVGANGGGIIQGDAINTVDVTGDLTAQQGILLDIADTIFGSTGNFTGGRIDGDAIVTLSAQNITTPSTASGIPGIDVMAIEASIYPNASGTVGGDAIVNVSAVQDISAPGSVLFWIANGNYLDLGGGTIGGDATVNVSAASLSTGDLFVQILNYGGASIGGDAAINVTADTLSVGGNLDSRIDNTSGGIIGGANLSFNLTGDLTTQGEGDFRIFNDGGTIGANAAINLTAASVSTVGNFNEILSSNSGQIPGSANVTLNLSGDLTSQSGAFFQIFDTTGGNVAGDATINVAALGDIDTQGTAAFHIYNNDAGSGAGVIGSDAAVSVSASNISSNYLETAISNEGGNIGGSAVIDFGASGNITTVGDALFSIANSSGTIGSDATMNVSAMAISIGGSLVANISNDTGGNIVGSANLNVTAADITANSFVAQIDNTGGSIGASTEGGATINMNLSGTATVTNDATVAIYGSDGAASAAININGGSYDAGGTFLAFIDQDGTITFNNASAHADVLKVGALGTNGVLRIGGGILSADTTLELYASGSNSQLHFVSNVTLGGNSAKILAANSVTIFDNVVVTIGGKAPADVYTNNANYTGFGGNETTTGTFAGAGANDPQPLSNAPPFGSTKVKPQTLSSTNVTSSGKGGGKATGTAINVSSSDQLLSLLDGAALGPGGKITVPGSKIASNWRNSSRLNAAGRLGADRRTMDIRTASSLPTRRLPQ